MRRIRLDMEEGWEENKRIKFGNVSTLLSLIDSTDKDYILGCICKEILRNVPELRVMHAYLLPIAEKIQIKEYPKDTVIVECNRPLDQMVFIMEGKIEIETVSSAAETLEGSLDECKIYGKELLSRALSTPADLNCLPISTGAVKGLTKVEGFVLTAEVLKDELRDYYHMMQENHSDEDHMEVSNSIEEESSSSSLTSTILAARAVSRFQRLIRRKKPAFDLDLDPYSYKGL